MVTPGFLERIVHGTEEKDQQSGAAVATAFDGEDELTGVLIPDSARAGAVDERAFKDAVGTFPTGVVVVTARCGPAGVGFTASSFTSVSLRPPLVSVSLSRRASSIATFRPGLEFVIHVLATGQDAVALHFARAREDKFEGIGAGESDRGVPLLLGCAATIECVLARLYDGGDHVIFLGRVHRASSSNVAALVHHQGTFHRIQDAIVPEVDRQQTQCEHQAGPEAP